MDERLKIEREDIKRYIDHLEEILPTHFDGTETEYGLLVQLSYLPQSIKLDYIEETDDTLTPYFSGWTYIVQRNEMRGDFFTPTDYINLFVEIPIDMCGDLILDEIDFLGQLTPTTEYTFDV